MPTISCAAIFKAIKTRTQYRGFQLNGPKEKKRTKQILSTFIQIHKLVFILICSEVTEKKEYLLFFESLFSYL